MIYVVSLPPIDSRYTKQWYDMTEKYIRDKGRKDIVLLGEQKMFTVKPTEFLNYKEYFGYVWPQILEAIKAAESGDTVFFMDGETAGAEALEYVRKMEGMDLDIRMYWHSGTYDMNDLPYLRNVKGEHFERGLFEVADRIFVGSTYHEKLLVRERNVPARKITVTGSPMDLDNVLDGSKMPKVRKFLFTGRKVKEKGYDVIRDLQAQGIDITVSLDNRWDKDEYHKQIAQSEMMVNPSTHELFGYAMMEAFSENVPVMVPDIPIFSNIPNMYKIPQEDFAFKRTFLERAEAILRSAGNERELVRPYEYHRVMDAWFGGHA